MSSLDLLNGLPFLLFLSIGYQFVTVWPSSIEYSLNVDGPFLLKCHNLFNHVSRYGSFVPNFRVSYSIFQFNILFKFERLRITIILGLCCEDYAIMKIKPFLHVFIHERRRPSNHRSDVQFHNKFKNQQWQSSFIQIQKKRNTKIYSLLIFSYLDKIHDFTSIQIYINN